MQNFTISWIGKLMRITLIQATLAMTLCGVVIAGDNFAQLLEKEVTVKYRHESIRNVLSGIERTHGVKFAYSGSLSSLEDKVSINVSRTRLKTVLETLLTPRKITYTEQSDFIILSGPKAKSDQAMSDPEGPGEFLNVDISDRIVSGTVMDSDTKDALPGVNILVKGTANGTTTDAAGK